MKTEELIDKIVDIEMELRMSHSCLVELCEENETLKKLLVDALPHIECKNQYQSNLITAIGEAINSI